MKKIISVIVTIVAIILASEWSVQKVHAAVNDGDVNSVMNGLITQMQINQTNKPQFGDMAGSSETIDPASGKLVWERTDIHLPGRDGLDLDIGVMYDSNQAFCYMRQYGIPGIKKYNYLISRYDLGVGWSFKFPSIQLADGYLYYHTGNGPIYRIDFNATDSLGSYTHLVGYQGKNLRMMRDTQGVFSNGQGSSAYYLEYMDKKREYFAADGRLLGIVDRYGNTITFEHIDRQVYDGQTYKVISKITDTVGRTVQFDYETTVQTAGEFNGEQIFVTVKDPNHIQSQQIVYRKWRSSLTYSGNPDGYIPYLWSIKNQENRFTNFYHKWEAAYQHYSRKSRDSYSGNTSFYLLNQVISPNSAVNYEHEMITRNYGVSGFGEEFRVKKRYDQLKKNGVLIGEYNVANIGYSGDYTGYPTHYNASNLPTSYTYFSNSVIQSNTPTNGLQSKSIFNGKGQLMSSETVVSSGEKKIMFNTAFHSVLTQQPIRVRYEEYGVGDTASTSNKLYKDIQYTDWGGVQSETAFLPLSDYNNSSIKSKHTVSYTYDPTYYFLKTRSWYQSLGSTTPSTETYGYYSNGRLESYTNAQNEKTSYCYDVLNSNNTTSSNCSNPSTVINGKVTKVKESRPIRAGQTAIKETYFTAASAHAYPSEIRSYFTTKNSAGQNVSKTVKKTMQYNMGTGLLKEETDSNNKTTQYQYDAMGRVSRVIYPNFTNTNGEQFSAADEYTYYYSYVPSTAMLANQSLNTFRVDYQRKYTRLSNNTTTLLSRQSSYYDGFGSLLYDLHNNNGTTQITQYEMDDLTRARQALDPLNNTTMVAYDAWGNQREGTDAYGNLYVFEYQLKQRRNISYFVAAANVAAYRTNPTQLNLRSNYVEQDFDHQGQLLTNRAYKSWPSTSQPIAESYTYDLVGNVVGYNDPKGNLNNEGVTTRYSYDKLDRLIRVKDALGQLWNYQYDANNQIVNMTVQNSDTAAPQQLKNNNYTEMGGLSNKADNVNNSDSYRYNDLHMLEQRRDRNHTDFTYLYDDHYRVIQQTASAVGKPAQQTKSIIGSNGILQDKTELYKGGQLVISMTTGIDHLKRVTSVSMQSANPGYTSALTLAYDRNNRITRVGSGAASANFFTNYTFDKLRLDKVQTNGLSSVNSTDAANVKYEYWPNGALKSITYPPLADGSILKTEYAYNALNQMTSITNRKGVTVLSSTTQTYDNNGNIETVTQVRQGEANTTNVYTYDKLNRLATITRPDGKTISYTYDTKGNRQTVNEAFNLENITYEYDLYNTLTSVTKGGQTTAFEYSPDGLRYKKTTGAAVTQFRYNQNREVIAEVNANNQTTAHYVRGDRLLVKKDVASAKDYYYLYNAHGDVIQIVDTNGVIQNSYKYDEWGNIVLEMETIHNPFKYAGEIYDEETGMYYLRARYYDPGIGRFINEDTYEGELNNPLTLNLYTYVHNNPLIYVDPTGHFAFLLPLLPAIAPGLTGLGTLGMGIWVNHELNNDRVIQQPKVEQKPTVIQQPPVVQQKPVVNQQPVVQQKPTVTQQPKVQQKPTVIQQPVVKQDPTVLTSSNNPSLGRGHTGRFLPNTLTEKLALEQVMSNPSAGRPINVPMTDPRWNAQDGWVKMAQNVNGIEIHYTRNTRTGQVDDFKFKN